MHFHEDMKCVNLVVFININRICMCFKMLLIITWLSSSSVGGVGEWGEVAVLAGGWVGGDSVLDTTLFSLCLHEVTLSDIRLSVTHACETGAPADKCYSKAPVNSLSNQQLFSQAYQYVLYGERTIWEYLRKKLFQLLATELKKWR